MYNIQNSKCGSSNAEHPCGIERSIEGGRIFVKELDKGSYAECLFLLGAMKRAISERPGRFGYFMPHPENLRSVLGYIRDGLSRTVIATDAHGYDIFGAALLNHHGDDTDLEFLYARNDSPPETLPALLRASFQAVSPFKPFTFNTGVCVRVCEGNADQLELFESAGMRIINTHLGSTYASLNEKGVGNGIARLTEIIEEMSTHEKGI